MNTRQEILEYLRKNPTASAQEIAQAISLTRANVQYHLARLERTGEVYRTRNRLSADRRGRPVIQFALSSSQKPNNLAQLAEILLKSYLDPSLPAGERLIRMNHIAQQILADGSPSPALTVRLNRLVKELSGLGYQARWEARAEGPVVVFRNCPYAAVIENHPELCLIDAALLANTLDAPVKQTAKIQIPTVSACRFRFSTGDALGKKGT